MDLAALENRKFALIKALINSNKEELIKKLELFLRSEGITIEDEEVKPMSLHEYRKGIDRAISDFENGKYKSHDELKEIINRWNTE